MLKAFNPESQTQFPVLQASSSSIAGTVALHTPYNQSRCHLHAPVTKKIKNHEVNVGTKTL